MRHFYVGATPEVDREVLAGITHALPRRTGLEPVPLELPSIDFAYDERRNQYASNAVLEMLLRECPRDADKLLALTERDLFIPVLTFVYGQAQLGGRVGAVSLARLRQQFYGLPPDPGVLLDRALKEILHESGHLYGLVHCADRACAMSLSTGIRQIDGKQASYCAACAVRLERGFRESQTT
jgi:archaemetzincin